MECNEVVHLHLSAWYLLDSHHLEASLFNLHRQVAASWNSAQAVARTTTWGFFLWPGLASLLHESLGTGTSDMPALALRASLQG